MSIVTEVNRLKVCVSNAYTALGEKGATIPSAKTAANLKSTVESISNADTVNGIHMQIRSSAPVAIDTSMLTFVANL